MSTPSKVLIAGDVCGHFDVLFGRVRTILKKSGPFEMLLCVGDFFGPLEEQANWESYRDGTKEVPLPTYILGPVTASQSKLYGKSVEDGGDLCSNLTYLGRRGFFTLSSGLQIAYLSGIYDETIYSKSERDPEHFLKEDTDYLLSRTTGTDYMGVDILLTTEWPKSVSNFAASPEGLDTNNVGSAPISQLAQALKPRYHFASLMKTFYERSPYRNHKILQESQTHVTRFIALANTNNPDKKKRYLYAFNVAPMATMMREALIVQPPNVTECPYQSLGVQQKQSLKTEQQKSYFFDMGSGQESRKRGDSQQYEQGPHPKQHKPPMPQGSCWFCLGSPEVERHLIVSVGENCYLALPKGGLVSEHTLILPIGHFRSSLELPEDVAEEAGKFKQALRQYYRSKRQTLVIFERNFHSPHLQFQAVPVLGKTPEDLREIFMSKGQEQGMEFIEVPRTEKITNFISLNVPFFCVEFDAGPRLLHRIRGRFPVQFGREIMASSEVLNVPERVDWKVCTVPKGEETELAATLRRKFQPFDFTREL